jgi:iron complex outermembrane recepter protein
MLHYPTRKPARRLPAVVYLVLVLGLGIVAIQAAQVHRRSFDIPASAADQALKRLAEQSGREVLFPSDAVEGVRTRRVRGEMTASEALAQMLRGTGLVGVEDPRTGALTVRRHISPAGNGNPTRRVSSASAGGRAGTGDNGAAPQVRSDALQPAASGTGSVTGRVRNEGTGVYLEGARVQVAGTHLQAVTERDGWFIIENVPAGTVYLNVAYTGLDPQQLTVVVESGGTTTRDIPLTSSVYMMDPYTVTSVREGQAAAITLQRVAPNVKNVAATDAFGNIADGNIAEFVKRLPGVTADSVQNEAMRVIIRGMNPDLNSVTFEGMEMASAGNSLNRRVNINETPIGSIETIEVTKSPTPDMDANSIGGNVNLVPKTAFGRADPRRITFSASANVRIHNRNKTTPSGSFSYSDVYWRKLGVTFSVSSSGNYQPVERTMQDWQFTLDQPAYLRLWRTVDNQITRTRSGIALRLDYKLAGHTTVSLNSTWNEFISAQDQYHWYNTPIFQVATLDESGRPIPFQTQFPHGHPSYQPGGFNANGARVRAGIMPGYTEDRVHFVNSTVRALRQKVHNSTRTYSLQPTGRTRLGWIDLDYTGLYSNSRAQAIQEPHRPSDPRGQGIEFNITGVDWLLDGTESITFRKMTQTAITHPGGRDMYDPANLTMTPITHRTNRRWTETHGGQLNARFRFTAPVPSYIKTGVKYRSQERKVTNPARRWTFTGPGGLGQFIDPDYTYRMVGGRYATPPFPDVGRINQLLHDRPEYFTPDLVYGLTQDLNSRKKASEDVYAGYIMGGFTLGRFSVLSGVRVEETHVKGTGLYRDPRRAVGITDPVERVRAEYGSRTVERDYRNVFPGVHFRFEPSRDWVARASYSTSIGRPNFGTIIPDTTVNATNQTVSENNTGLRPQTSQNFDLSLERYFEPVGLISAGAFLKEINNFFFSTQTTIPAGPDNGYDGDYAGWRLTTQFNGGFARVRGLEFNYQQQFSFLPGFWSGFGIYGNYTYLQTKGDYGMAGRTVSEIENFKPQVINGGISYSKYGFTGRIHATSVGRWLDSYNVDPSRLIYAKRQTLVDINLEYRITRRYNVFVDVQNVFDAPDVRYQALPHRISIHEYLGQRVGFGISGRY